MPKIHRDRPATDQLDIVAQVPPREPPNPPVKKAGKAKWVAYAEAISVDSSGTKAQIIARVNG
jgi:hypothetical protein